MSWHELVWKGVLTGRIPFFAVDNGVVTSQRFSVAGETPRFINPACLAPTSCWLAESLVPSVDENIGVTGLIGVNPQDYRKSTWVAINTAATGAAPTAISATTLNLGTLNTPTANTAVYYENSALAEPLNFAQAGIYVGTVLRVAAVAPIDSVNGGIPAGPTTIVVKHSYGRPGSLFVVYYTLRTQECSLDTTELFMPFICGPAAATGFSGDYTIPLTHTPDPVWGVTAPATYTVNATAGYSGTVTNKVEIIMGYNTPILRVEIELVKLGEVATRSCVYGTVVGSPGGRETEQPGGGETDGAAPTSESRLPTQDTGLCPACINLQVKPPYGTFTGLKGGSVGVATDQDCSCHRDASR